MEWDSVRELWYVKWYDLERAKSMQQERQMVNHGMSRDRVRFYIGDQYFSKRDNRYALMDVMVKAFGMDEQEAGPLILKAFDQGHGGFHILCRPSQFARFMIYRHAAGLKNGFMDLGAKLEPAKPKQTIYRRIGEQLNIDPEVARAVLNVAGVALGDIKLVDEPEVTDVSMNPAKTS